MTHRTFAPRVDPCNYGRRDEVVSPTPLTPGRSAIRRLEMILGREGPRLQTPDPYERWTEKNTFGFECIRFAEDFLALPMLPWQRYFLLRALVVDAVGDFLYRTVLLLVGGSRARPRFSGSSSCS